MSVTVEADGIGRYAREAEAAVYFSCLEALQNVSKYASASRATVVLTDGDSQLRFEVTDDGAGFDPASSTYGTVARGDRRPAGCPQRRVEGAVGSRRGHQRGRDAPRLC